MENKMFFSTLKKISRTIVAMNPSNLWLEGELSRQIKNKRRNNSAGCKTGGATKD